MRPDDLDPAAIQVLLDHVFPATAPYSVERVAEGVSTHVYRVRRGAETFYLRILPEVDASLAPEVWVHGLLRARGVHVPEVVHFEHCNEILQRSVMVTTEIKGCHLGHRPVDQATRQVLIEAGRQLAIINSVPVAGFGWIRRDQSAVTRLQAEHATYRAFAAEHLDTDLAALEAQVLTRQEIAAIRVITDRYTAWFDGEQGWLAHGDFDVTPIYQQDGRYTGIIDFGEIRGTDRWYDLGHFRMHDGETLPSLVLDWLLEGYRAATPLPADYHQRICFARLVIAILALARHLQKEPHAVRQHQGVLSIWRDLPVLYP